MPPTNRNTGPAKTPAAAVSQANTASIVKSDDTLQEDRNKQLPGEEGQGSTDNEGTGDLDQQTGRLGNVFEDFSEEDFDKLSDEDQEVLLLMAQRVQERRGIKSSPVLPAAQPAQQPGQPRKPVVATVVSQEKMVDFHPFEDHKMHVAGKDYEFFEGVSQKVPGLVGHILVHARKGIIK